jgi:hypothetical protein
MTPGASLGLRQRKSNCHFEITRQRTVNGEALSSQRKWDVPTCLPLERIRGAATSCARLIPRRPIPPRSIVAEHVLLCFHSHAIHGTTGLV